MSDWDKQQRRQRLHRKQKAKKNKNSYDPERHRGKKPQDFSEKQSKFPPDYWEEEELDRELMETMRQIAKADQQEKYYVQVKD